MVINIYLAGWTQHCQSHYSRTSLIRTSKIRAPLLSGKPIKSVGKCLTIHASKWRKILFTLDVSRWLVQKFCTSNGM